MQKYGCVKTMSVALGAYFDDFIKSKIAQGRYNNARKMVIAALRLLEENESCLIELKNVINGGIKSGRTENFDPEQHLLGIKAKRSSG